MKKRRTLIVALLLVATMVMGIGYASYTRTLKINGDAIFNQEDSNFVVVFENPTIAEQAADGSAITPPSEDLKATAVVSAQTTLDFNAHNLKAKGDKIIVTVDIANRSKAQDIVAKLAEILPAAFNYNLSVDGEAVANPTFLDVSYSIKKGGTEVWNDNTGKVGEGLILEYGETATLEMTLELTHSVVGKMIIEDANLTLNFTGTVAAHNN